MEDTIHPITPHTHTHTQLKFNREMYLYLLLRKYKFDFPQYRASQVMLVVKNPPASAGDTRDLGSIPGLGRYPGVGNGNPLQCSYLENSMDRGAWWAPDHEVEKSRT